MTQKKYIKKEFYKIMQLYGKQEWLIDKSTKLDELIAFCDTETQTDLVIDLLSQFQFLSQRYYQFLLNQIADYIISKFDMNETQILSLTKTEDADSGQMVLYHLRNSLFGKGWKDCKTVNKLGSAHKIYKRGYKKIIFFDEFIGSGQTLIGRINELKGMIQEDFELECCFVSGMKYALENLQEQEIKLFCPLQLERGISDRYQGDALRKAEDDMLDLELKLTPWIKDKELYNFSFGWKDSEALYSLEGCNGNTPNNVFPIFWWPLDIKDVQRNHILTRVEAGF